MLLEAIDTFLLNKRISMRTKKCYFYRLNDFTLFLSLECNCDPKDINLNEIYKISDKNGIIIVKKPIDSKIITKYLMSLETGATEKYYLLHNFFNFLFNQDLINYNPFHIKFLNPKIFNKKQINSTTYLGVNDITKFFTSLISHSKNLERDLLIFIILFTTGARNGEILELRKDDIDLQLNKIRLKKTKNNNQHTIFLRNDLTNYIYKYCELFNIEDRIFYDLNHTSLSNLFKNYLEKANLPEANLHRLRHSFITLLAEQGLPKNIIAQLTGHRDINSLDTYTNPNIVRNKKVTLDYHREFYNKMRNPLAKLL